MRCVPSPHSLFWVAIGLCHALTLVGCKRSLTLGTSTVPAAQVGTVVATPPEREPAPGQTRVLGTGWYANVEVDAQDRLHFAWTDADLGDVLYAVSEPQAVVPGAPSVVESDGAVGSYLRLSVAPGGVPVLAYYDQDDKTLRLAHRPADLERMATAGARLGAKVTRTPPKVRIPGEKPPPPPQTGMGPGWHGEEVAFGDNAGLAGDLTVDNEGVPHLIYYTKNEKLRYATRPSGVAAFGVEVNGVFDKQDIDERAGGSYTMSTDVIVTDGTVVASYCNWNYIDSQLKIAIRPKGESLFQVVEATPLEKLVDGWHSTLLPVGDGKVEVFSVANGEARLLRGTLDLQAPTPLLSRSALVERPSATVVRRAADGTLWVLTRLLGLPSFDEQPGVSLVEIPKGDMQRAHRFLLEPGLDRDPWIDLELLSDGTPVAVWSSRESLSMKMYVHRRAATTDAALNPLVSP
ncbi:MAG: hypothetical protein ACO3JL_05975 [Myxococcota bacterium]